MTSFSVVTYMRESRSIVERFVAYYRSLGAQHIQIYFDGSIDTIADLSDGTVSIAPCDDAFWAAGPGHRPAGLEVAQAFCFMAGYLAAKTDWVMILDADEFVFGPLSVSEMLEQVPDDIDALILPTAEAVSLPEDKDPFSVFSSTGFRLATEGSGIWIERAVYGWSLSRVLRHGLMGHADGKQILRTGKRFDKIGCHRAFRDGSEHGSYAKTISPDFAGMYVGHYDAIGFERWKDKWSARLDGTTRAEDMSKRRLRQLELARVAFEQGDKALRRLYARCFSLNRFQWHVLKKLGLAFQKDIFAVAPRLDPSDKG